MAEVLIFMIYRACPSWSGGGRLPVKVHLDLMSSLQKGGDYSRQKILSAAMTSTIIRQKNAIK